MANFAKLIKNYTDAKVAESWAGSQDPTEVPVIKAAVKYYREALNRRIAQLYLIEEARTVLDGTDPRDGRKQGKEKAWPKAKAKEQPRATHLRKVGRRAGKLRRRSAH